MMAASALRRLNLEIGEHNRAPVMVATVSFVVAVVLLGVAVVGPEEIQSSTATGSFQTKTITNAKGGYAFTAPASWVTQKQGRSTTLFSADRDVVVAVGPAPKGDLAAAGEQVFGSMTETYSKVRFLGASRQTVGGREAVVFSGLGTNDDKVRLRFVGVTFIDGGRNHSMTAFTRMASDPERVLPRIETILDSFSPSTR
jgi:hypothetical protein